MQSWGLREDPSMQEMHGLTEIASNTLMFRYPIEANERSISNRIEDRVQNDSRFRHFEVDVDWGERQRGLLCC